MSSEKLRREAGFSGGIVDPDQKPEQEKIPLQLNINNHQNDKFHQFNIEGFLPSALLLFFEIFGYIALHPLYLAYFSVQGKVQEKKTAALLSGVTFLISVAALFFFVNPLGIFGIVGGAAVLYGLPIFASLSIQLFVICCKLIEKIQKNFIVLVSLGSLPVIALSVFIAGSLFVWPLLFSQTVMIALAIAVFFITSLIVLAVSIFSLKALPGGLNATFDVKIAFLTQSLINFIRGSFIRNTTPRQHVKNGNNITPKKHIREDNEREMQEKESAEQESYERRIFEVIAQKLEEEIDEFLKPRRQMQLGELKQEIDEFSQANQAQPIITTQQIANLREKIELLHRLKTSNEDEQKIQALEEKIISIIELCMAPYMEVLKRSISNAKQGLENHRETKQIIKLHRELDSLIEFLIYYNDYAQKLKRVNANPAALSLRLGEAFEADKLLKLKRMALNLKQEIPPLTDQTIRDYLSGLTKRANHLLCSEPSEETLKQMKELTYELSQLQEYLKRLLQYKNELQTLLNQEVQSKEAQVRINSIRRDLARLGDIEISSVLALRQEILSLKDKISKFRQKHANDYAAPRSSFLWNSSDDSLEAYDELDKALKNPRSRMLTHEFIKKFKFLLGQDSRDNALAILEMALKNPNKEIAFQLLEIVLTLDNALAILEAALKKPDKEIAFQLLEIVLKNPDIKFEAPHKKMAFKLLEILLSEPNQEELMEMVLPKESTEGKLRGLLVDKLKHLLSGTELKENEPLISEKLFSLVLRHQEELGEDFVNIFRQMKPQEQMGKQEEKREERAGEIEANPNWSPGLFNWSSGYYSLSNKEAGMLDTSQALAVGTKLSSLVSPPPLRSG